MVKANGICGPAHRTVQWRVLLGVGAGLLWGALGRPAVAAQPSSAPAPSRGEVIIRRTSAAWESQQVQEPCILPNPKDPARLVMFYSGVPATNRSVCYIGKAWALKSDPFTWHQDDHNPVFRPAEQGWDSGSIRLDAALYIPEEDAYYVYYSGAKGSVQDRIGLAICPAGPDGYSDITPAAFQRVGAQPVFSPEPAAPYFEQMASQAAVLRQWDATERRWQWFLYYSYRGKDGILPGLRLATSHDGRNWIRHFNEKDPRGMGQIFASTPGAYYEWHQVSMIDDTYVLVIEVGVAAGKRWRPVIAVSRRPDAGWEQLDVDTLLQTKWEGLYREDTLYHVATPALYPIGGRWYLFAQACPLPANGNYIDGQWDLWCIACDRQIPTRPGCESLFIPGSTRPVDLPQSFALETFAHRNLNYLNRMVDTNGLPYFNIFWTDPAEAAHDWPDFGDVMARQYQAAIMARHITGERAPIEAVWRRKLLELIDPATGLLTRPQTSFSQRVADPGDQALTLYALVTAYADAPEDSLKRTILKMTARLLAQAEEGKSGGGGFLNGFMIKSLMASVRILHDPNALRLAQLQVHRVFVDSPLFSPDNTFRHGGHTHGNLRTLVGVADYALYARDPVLFSRVDALYRYVRSTATSFGFLPEVIGRQGDVVAAETCAIMDYIGLAVTLANHGHPEYWGGVERVVRNQLVESQATDLAWLKPAFNKPDTAQFTWRDLAGRLAGGYAGWSSPTHFLATCETLHWGGPELRGKTRVVQNCCGGSGTHAFFIAWKNAASFENGTLAVHLHFDKLLPQAEIRGDQPFQGRLRIHLKTDCAVRVRLPDFVPPGDLKAAVGGTAIPVKIWGNYAELGRQRQGTTLNITYPLVARTEEVQIGNPGFRHYHYRVHWLGDTVMTMEPLDQEYATGYSDFEKKEVPVFYGKAGPGPLYQRAALRRVSDPALATLHEDDGQLNFWAGLQRPSAPASSGVQTP